MVRVYSILAAFLAVTLALVLLQPAPDSQTATSDSALSRDAVNLLNTVEDSAPALDRLVAQALAEPPAPVAPPAPPRAALVTAPDEMQQLTFAALNDLNRATGKRTLAGQQGTLLHSLVQRALAATPPAQQPYLAALAAEALTN